MDALKLATSWSNSGLPPAPLPMTIEGLLLQGCNFDGSRLSEAHAEDPTFVPAPLCNLAWVPQSVNTGAKSVLEVPLYMGPSRETIVCTLGVPVDSSGEGWILAGVAFFLKAE